MLTKTFFESPEFIFNHDCKDAPQNFPMHIHDVYELIYLKKGDVSYVVEGRLYTPSQNCLILTRPLENHTITFNSPIPYERYNILIDEKMLNSNILSKISSSAVMLNFASHTLVSDIFNKMDYYCEYFQGDELKILLMHLTEEVLYNCALASQSTDETTIYSTNPIIQAVLKYIDLNIHTPLNMDTLCKEFFISQSHLYHLFIKHLMLTPQNYILSKKMAIAQRELRSGKKATNVFVDCGFADYSTFYRAYKKTFGHAPSDEINTDIIREIQS